MDRNVDLCTQRSLVTASVSREVSTYIYIYIFEKSSVANLSLQYTDYMLEVPLQNFVVR